MKRIWWDSTWDKQWGHFRISPLVALSFATPLQGWVETFREFHASENSAYISKSIHCNRPYMGDIRGKRSLIYRKRCCPEAGFAITPTDIWAVAFPGLCNNFMLLFITFIFGIHYIVVVTSKTMVVNGNAIGFGLHSACSL